MICLDYSQICPPTGWRISPHSVKPRASKAPFPPQSKTLGRGAFFVLLSPSAYCPHNQINTAANSSGRRTHPKNGGESQSDQKQTAWSYWIDHSPHELIGNSLLSSRIRDQMQARTWKLQFAKTLQIKTGHLDIQHSLGLPGILTQDLHFHLWWNLRFFFFSWAPHDIRGRRQGQALTLHSPIIGLPLLWVTLCRSPRGLSVACATAASRTRRLDERGGKKERVWAEENGEHEPGEKPQLRHQTGSDPNCTSWSTNTGILLHKS